jgi:hypothetical protein
MIGPRLRLLLFASALLSMATAMTGRGWAGGPAAQDRPRTIATRVALPLLAPPHEHAVPGEPHPWSRSLDEAPLPDVAGRWTGTWSGLGVMSRRTSTAQAEFIQAGRWGWGKIILADTLAADVPSVVSYRGALGVPVLFDVFQSAVLVKHEAGGSHLTAVFRIEGDRMIGTLRGHGTLIVLARQR